MAAKFTKCVSFDTYPEAKDAIVRLFVMGESVGADVGFSVTNPNVSRVVCFAMRTAVESAQTIAALRDELAAMRGITKPPTDAERLAAAMARAGLTRPILAVRVGCHVDTIRNVAKRGFKLTGALVVGVEGGGV